MAERRPWFRVAAVIVALVLGALLAACGGSDGSGGGSADPGQPDETTPPRPCPVDALGPTDEQDTATTSSAPPEAITVWAPFTGDARTALDQLVATYNRSQSRVAVTVEAIAADPAAQRERYRQAVVTSTLPALVAVDATLTQFIVDSGHAVDASACMKEAGDDGSAQLPVARNAYTVDGKQWAASANLVTPLLYFRRGAFTAAGLDPDKPPATLDQLHDVATAMRAAGILRPLALRVDSALAEHWLTGDSAAIVNHNNGRDSLADASKFSANPTVQLLEWLRTMQTEGLLNVLPPVPDGVPPDPAAVLQTSALTIAPSTAVTGFAPAILGSAPDLDVAPLPGLSNAGHGQVAGQAWYLTKDLAPTQIAAAWDFVTFLNSVPSQITWNLVGGFPPFNPRAVDDPRLVDAWSASRRGPWLDTAYGQVTNLDPAGPGPLIGPYPKVRSSIDAALEGVLSGAATPDAAMATSDAAITAALSSYDPGNP